MIGYIISGIVILVAVVLAGLYLIRRSKGKVFLELNKMDFVVGETIRGVVKLNLKRRVEAEALNLRLVGVRRNSGRQNSSVKIFDFIKQIDKRKIYPVGESSYEFELKIPEDAKPRIENPVFNTLVKTAQFVAGQRVDWHLIAYLDMRGFDLKKKLRIYIN